MTTPRFARRSAVSQGQRLSRWHVYKSGAELAAKSARGEPGCILLDVPMAGLGGLELQDHLDALDSRLPIVFVTGQGDIPISVRAIKAGADDFLSKPVSRHTLLEAIERALGALSPSSVSGTTARRLRDPPGHAHGEGAGRSSTWSLAANSTSRSRTSSAASERTIKAHRQPCHGETRSPIVCRAVSIAERLGLLGARRGGKAA